MNATTRFSRFAFALACGLLAQGAALAQMTMFLQPNFEGRQATLRGNEPSLADIGFHDQVSSIVVDSGRWEVCTQPEFKGDCAVLTRGRYPRLDARFNHRIESARAVERRAGSIRDDGQASIEIYLQPRFEGRSALVRGDSPDLASFGLHDQASSIVVNSGRWELCTQPDFRGDCVTFTPGEYPVLDARLNHRVESVREVGRSAGGAREYDARDRGGREDRGRREYEARGNR